MKAIHTGLGHGTGRRSQTAATVSTLNTSPMLSRVCVAWFCAVLVFCLAGDSSAAAQFSKVEHSPNQPSGGEAVTITAILNGPAESVFLEYQIVEPGGYIALKDGNYRSNWKAVPMEKFHSDNRYLARIPGSEQVHRRLIRYRFKGEDSAGSLFVSPPSSVAEPNYAYFVYDGTPAWKAAVNPRSNNRQQKQVVEFPATVMDQIQTYILIAKERDVEDATWHQKAMDKEYRHTGTLVANGRVYDHIRFRARGGEWRYAMGKNMWKFDFHKANRFQAHDDYGRPYRAMWSKINLRACIQQADYGRRGEQGMYEAVGFRLFNLAGVEAPRTHWISLRIIDGPEENPADQYRGDYWGLYLAIENEDGRFLDEHELPDGNIYKMKFGRGELENHGKNQPSDGSDLAQLLPRLNRPSDPGWWRENVDLQRYYSYRSILEAIHHYDLDAGKNYTFYRNPGTSKWHVIPWDIDLSWGEHMFGGGNEPFKRPVLSHSAYQIEYQNRLREIRDLLFNPAETGRLIDECAAIIWRKGQLSIADADRAKWDYHPIMVSRHALQSKAGHGHFYEAVRSRNFGGMVEQMKEFVERRSGWIDRTLLKDISIPEKPEITYAGPAGFPISGLKFRASDFRGREGFAAMRWRIAEIAEADFRTKPAQPGKYEITAAWESDEITAFNPVMTIPSNAVAPGGTYRIRVRFKNNAGRWSHWSDPVQFTAATVK